MAGNPLENLEAAADQFIGNLKVSELPIAPLDVNSLILTVFSGDSQLAVRVISHIATTRYDLVINQEGKIDLPPNTVKKPEEKLVIRHKDPTIHVVSSTEMPRVSKKSTKRDSDGKSIHIED